MNVTDFVVCDDIRRELGEKFSLMGVFDREITINAGAAPLDAVVGLRMAFFIRIELADGEEPSVFDFSIAFDGEPLSVVTSPIERTPVNGVLSRRIRLALVSGDPLPVPRPGLFRFSLTVRNAAHAEIGVVHHEMRLTHVLRDGMPPAG